MKLDTQKSALLTKLSLGGNEDKKRKALVAWSMTGMESNKSESCWSIKKYPFFIRVWTARKLKVARFFFWIVTGRQSSKTVFQQYPYLDDIFLRPFDLILSRMKINTDSSDQKTLVTEVTRYSSLMTQVKKLRHGAVKQFDLRSCAN